MKLKLTVMPEEKDQLLSTLKELAGVEIVS